MDNSADSKSCISVSEIGIFIQILLLSSWFRCDTGLELGRNGAGWGMPVMGLGIVVLQSHVGFLASLYVTYCPGLFFQEYFWD